MKDNSVHLLGTGEIDVSAPDCRYGCASFTRTKVPCRVMAVILRNRGQGFRHFSLNLARSLSRESCTPVISWPCPTARRSRTQRGWKS